MTQSFPSFVIDDENQHLMEDVSKEELQVVLHSFQKDKSHSPKGWPMEFFLGFYEILEEDLSRVMEESHTSKKVPTTFNTTFIALIPKNDNPVSFEEFHPISLCNCI
jgi:hypothetical protein